MLDLRDKTVLITGASSGIGEACARAFAALGSRLILAARRHARLLSLAHELMQDHGAACHPIELDVRDKRAVEAAFSDMPAPWREVDLLVNNAGLSRRLDRLQEGDPADWDAMLDTNVKGLLYVSRQVLPGMIARGHGHVVNLGSIAGLEAYQGGNVYCASKAAVRMLSRALRLDLNGTGVRVTLIEPGMTRTEFSLVRFDGDNERADGVYAGVDSLTAEDVAEAVVYCATRPPRVNIAELVLTPTQQASATVLHRRNNQGGGPTCEK